MRYYEPNHLYLNLFLSPTGSFGSAYGDQGYGGHRKPYILISC